MGSRLVRHAVLFPAASHSEGLLEICTQKCLTNKMLLYSCFQKRVSVNTCYDLVCAQFSHKIYGPHFRLQIPWCFPFKLVDFVIPVISIGGADLAQYSRGENAWNNIAHRWHSQSSHMYTDMFWSKHMCHKPKTSTETVVVALERHAVVCKCHMVPCLSHVFCMTT